MKLSSVVALAMCLLLVTHQAASVSLYDQFIESHAWNVGRYVGACVLQTYRTYGLTTFGLVAWTGFCACHSRVLVEARTASGTNLGPYLRGVLQCCLVSPTTGVAVIGADVIHCVAAKVNQAVETGGK